MQTLFVHATPAFYNRLSDAVVWKRSPWVFVYAMLQVDPRPVAAHGLTGLVDRIRARYAAVSPMNPQLKGIRAYANWFRSNCELWARTSQVRARPLKLVIDPTNACQLRCALCPTGLRLHDREIGLAQRWVIEGLLDELGEYLFFIDFFNWGELVVSLDGASSETIGHTAGRVTSS